MTHSVNIANYAYDLPEDRIAKYPVDPRDASKLLVYDRGNISHRNFRDLPGLIEQGFMLVFNNTRVVQARLRFEKATGSTIEIFCLEPRDPADYNLAFGAGSGPVWKCLVGNAKKWKDTTLQTDITVGKGPVRLRAEKAGHEKDAFLIRFHWEPADIRFGKILEQAGKTPIPPYLKRDAESRDKKTYQTVYSRIDGSVAAPTAGLHFTESLLAKIRKRAIPTLELTLHVGAGTFRPVISSDLKDHPMHAEFFHLSRSSLESIINHKGGILAVGTTSSRVLESIYWIGSRLKQGDTPEGSPIFLDQWDAYRLPVQAKRESLETLLRHMDKRRIDFLEGMTRLMIVPGYKFRMVDSLLTNYHLPKSTLLLLVAALIGEDWRRVYEYALKNDFRFLSYGDSSLLIPGSGQ